MAGVRSVGTLRCTRGSIPQPRSIKYLNKRKLYKYWHRTKVLARKRNTILKAHGNCMEAFNLPEIKDIDAQSDYWEARIMRVIK